MIHDRLSYGFKTLKFLMSSLEMPIGTALSVTYPTVTGTSSEFRQKLAGLVFDVRLFLASRQMIGNFSKSCSKDGLFAFDQRYNWC